MAAEWVTDPEKMTILGMVLAALGANKLGAWVWSREVEAVRLAAEREIAQVRNELAKSERREEELRKLVFERRELIADALALAAKAKAA